MPKATEKDSLSDTKEYTKRQRYQEKERVSEREREEGREGDRNANVMIYEIVIFKII